MAISRGRGVERVHDVYGAGRYRTIDKGNAAPLQAAEDFEARCAPAVDRRRRAVATATATATAFFWSLRADGSKRLDEIVLGRAGGAEGAGQRHCGVDVVERERRRVVRRRGVEVESLGLWRVFAAKAAA